MDFCLTGRQDVPNLRPVPCFPLLGLLGQSWLLLQNEALQPDPHGSCGLSFLGLSRRQVPVQDMCTLLIAALEWFWMVQLAGR